MDYSKLFFKLIVLFFVFTAGCVTRQEKDQKSIEGDVLLAFYNVENLFDTLDDKRKTDNEFLPYKKKEWNTEKYNRKIHQIARVILGIGDWEGPDLIGLCEVENRLVLEDLIHDTRMVKQNYGIVHQECRDMRGIDVALLYKKDRFKVEEEHFYPIYFPFATRSKTRDILHVKGRFNGQEPIHLFVCHWPSRRGGQAKSEPKRIYVAEQLRTKVDSIQAVDRNAYILITGDLNDDPQDMSLLAGLKAKKSSEAIERDLFNLTWDQQDNNSHGTLKYQGKWNHFDQWIVSGNLRDEKAVEVTLPQVYKPEWLMTDDERYAGQKPFRTYQGVKFIGGYSDHLPVYLKMSFNQ